LYILAQSFSKSDEAFESSTQTAPSIYYHASTVEEIQGEDLDHDSELGIDETWKLKQSLQVSIESIHLALLIREKAISEFSDVTWGEKTVMKLWNEFIFHNRIFAEKQVGDTLELFLLEKREEIRVKKLEKSLLLHCLNLWQFGLLNRQDISKAMSILNHV